MVQLGFPEVTVHKRVVNVASVPQRSPFRYPGGKTWLVPIIRQWLESRGKPRQFVEPFAGGGIIGLTVAFERMAQTVVMVELDNDVASVWKTILGNSAEWLVDRVITFPLSVDSVQRELGKECGEPKEQAFQTLLRNRVSHGGILAPGSGVIKHGENGKGIKSRWYPVTLGRRILAIAAVRDRIKFIEGDGIEVLKAKSSQADAVFFIDPPYTAGGKRAGKRLYRHNDIDHEALFQIAEGLQGDFLMTYDNAQEVRALAQKHHFDTEVIPMKNTHNVNMTELLIGRDLRWLRGVG